MLKNKEWTEVRSFCLDCNSRILDNGFCSYNCKLDTLLLRHPDRKGKVKRIIIECKLLSEKTI